MRKTLLISMFLSNPAPFNQEITGRKIRPLLWFMGSAAFACIIVYLCTINSISSGKSSDQSEPNPAAAKSAY